MDKKRGLSLLVLTITIAVMIILASAVFLISANTTNNSKKAAFASDLEQIEDLVREYYLANNTLPIVSDSPSYNKSNFTALITNGKDTLESEISENEDDDAIFYKLELSKIDIKNTKRGLEKDGNSTDAYFITGNTFNVYYLQGEEIANEYYFSLSERLTGKAKVSNSYDLDTSNITISSSTGGIKLIKSTAEFTNALTVDVDVTLKNGETIKYFIAGQEITVDSNATTIDVASILTSNAIIKTAFYQSDDNKYLVAKKYDSSDVIAEVKLNIANLDILSGNISNANISYSQYGTFILAKISGYTDLGGSGIKEARVLYTTKVSGAAYYTNLPNTITKEYVKQSGKSFDATTLKIPADVKTFALVFVDNAGNVSDYVMCTAQIGLKLGDKINYIVPARSEPSLSTANGSGYQTISNQTDLTWVYIGVDENGNLLISPDVSSSTLTASVELEGAIGYLKGTEELNRLCGALYTVEGKGTARSMNIDDVNRILGYIGSTSGYWNASGSYTPTSESKKISQIVNSLGYSMSHFGTVTPDTTKQLGDYYANYYYIDKANDEGKMQYKDNIKYVFPSSGYYWLASSTISLDFEDCIVAFGVQYVSKSGMYAWSLLWDNGTSGGDSLLLRPVVKIHPSVIVSRQSDGSWDLK